MAQRRNGGQEFGELKAQVAALAETLHEFRVETRLTLAAMRSDLTMRMNGHAGRISKLERARTWMAGAIFAVGVMGGLAWGFVKYFGFGQ